MVTTFAGNGNTTSVDGVGTASSFNYPYGIDIDSKTGDLYVAEQHKIRKITSGINTA